MTPEEMNLLTRRMMLPVEKRLANTEDEVVRQGEQIMAIIAQVPALLAEITRLKLDLAVETTNHQSTLFQYRRDVPRMEEEIGSLIDQRYELLEEIKRLREENAAIRTDLHVMTEETRRLIVENATLRERYGAGHVSDGDGT